LLPGSGGHPRLARELCLFPRKIIVGGLRSSRTFYPAVPEAVSAGIFPVFSAFLLHFCEIVVF
jgi:hypothetical protein